MAPPSSRDLTTLLRWRPAGGVLSVYVDLAPGDRGEAWRIEVRNGLRAALEPEQGDDRDTRVALEETAQRVESRLGDSGRPDGRAQVGFVEVAKHGRELWYSLAMPAGPTTVSRASRPLLRPLLTALDDGAPRGVLAVSSERVRLLGWALGELEEIDSWGIELISGDWRERRSQRPPDPARAQGATASGRDQADQRLEANRERFLREAGKLAAQRAGGRGWQEVDAFGDDQHLRVLADGFAPSAPPLRHVEQHNLVSQPGHAIAARLEERLPEINRERERALVARARGDDHGGTQGALGLEETLQALLAGRVEHLLLDPDRRYELPEGSQLADGSDPDLPVAERMVELALSTSAAVTPLEGDAADRLAEHGGVAAVLRY